MRLQDLHISSLYRGASSEFNDGWIHRKTVPEAILLEPLTGYYHITSPNVDLEVHPESAVLIPANTDLLIKHHHGAIGKMSARWVHFSFRLYGTIDLSNAMESMVLLNGKLFRSANEILNNSIDQCNSSSLAQQTSLVCSLLSLLEALPKKYIKQLPVPTDPRLLQVLNVIVNHKGRQLSIEHLAKTAFLSPSHFQAWFAQHMGVSPMAYVRTHKMRCIASDLLTTTHPLKVLAEEYHFQNPFHLSRCFKQEYGISPREFRKENKSYSNGF